MARLLDTATLFLERFYNGKTFGENVYNTDERYTRFFAQSHWMSVQIPSFTKQNFCYQGLMGHAGISRERKNQMA
jgi:hypothetical protein